MPGSFLLHDLSEGRLSLVPCPFCGVRYPGEGVGCPKRDRVLECFLVKLVGGLVSSQTVIRKYLTAHVDTFTSDFCLTKLLVTLLDTVNKVLNFSV